MPTALLVHPDYPSTHLRPLYYWDSRETHTQLMTCWNFITVFIIAPSHLKEKQSTLQKTSFERIPAYIPLSLSLWLSHHLDTCCASGLNGDDCCVNLSGNRLLAPVRFLTHRVYDIVYGTTYFTFVAPKRGCRSLLRIPLRFRQKCLQQTSPEAVRVV